MRVIVGQPPLKPNSCAALPFPSITTDPAMRYVDTGRELEGFDNRVYVSETAVKEMARLLGHPTPQDHTTALDELDALRMRVHDLERENSRFEDAFTAIDVLESSDFRARRKAGRKPTQKAA